MTQDKLHNEELHDLYSLPNINRIIKSRRVRFAGHVARMGKKRNMCGKEGKRPLGRKSHRWIDNIRDGIGCCVQMESSCECWETTEWLNNLWPLDRYSAPQSQVSQLITQNKGNGRLS
jgi:hypothetical protein